MEKLCPPWSLRKRTWGHPAIWTAGMARYTHRELDLQVSHLSIIQSLKSHEELLPLHPDLHSLLGLIHYLNGIDQWWNYVGTMWAALGFGLLLLLFNIYPIWWNPDNLIMYCILSRQMTSPNVFIYYWNEKGATMDPGHSGSAIQALTYR